MSVLSSVIASINKAIIKATTAGDTRAVNKLTKLADKPDAVTNRIQQIEAKQAEYKDIGMESPIDTFHGGAMDNPSRQSQGLIFSSFDKNQAKAYAEGSAMGGEGNQGRINILPLDEKSLISENEATDIMSKNSMAPVNKDWNLEESQLYELLDPQFEQFIGNANVAKLKNIMAKEGKNGIRFTDYDMVSGGKKGAQNVVSWEKPGSEIDTYIHQTNAQGDINEGNFRYRAGSTPAAEGRGEGIFTSPTSYADQNAAYGARELGVVTARADASKLGQGQTRLAMDGPDAPETFIPEAQVQEIFEIKPATMQLTEMGNKTVSSIAKATDSFKASISDMRKNNDIKKMFEKENTPDENIVGMFIDSLRVIDENAAGQARKVAGHDKVYERISLQDLYDKVGRKVEARMTIGTKDRWSPAKRREAGAVMLNYTRGNLGDFIEEAMVKTKTGRGLDVKDELLLTTNKNFKDWARTGGRTLMNALEGPREARNPSINPHGDWVMNEAGEIVGFPRGSTKAEFFSGGTKVQLSESYFPSVIKSLNILGRQALGMDKDFFELTKLLGKKGILKERPGPLAEHKASLNLQRLTDTEQDELTEAYDVLQDALKEAFPNKPATSKQFIELKESVFPSRIKALDSVARETKTKGNQYKSKQSFTRRLDEELEKRFANDPEAKVYMQHNVDTRGRTSPIDPSGASLNSGGAIRHGFTGAKKPIVYGDEGFNQIIDDLVLFDDKAGLSKIQGTGLDRHSHWLKNKDTYLKQGQEALDNVDNPDWNPKWMNRKDAGPYLRGVIEVARIKKANDAGVPYESSMMIEVDAPSSGSQHIGAQYGDENVLKLTSVLTDPVDRTGLTAAEIRLLSEGVPDDAIAKDLYTDVGVKYKKHMQESYNELAATDPEKARLFKEISDEFLGGDRGIVKPIVMKVPYGAGNDTLKIDLNSQLDGRKKLAILERGVDPDELMEFHWNKGMARALNEGLATQYEFKQFNSLIGKIFNTRTNRKPLLVEGPSGDITDLTRYVMGSERTFRATIGPEGVPDLAAVRAPNWRGQEVTVYNQVPKEDISPEAINKIATDAKMVTQGMAPNVTHMMDAGFLHKLVQAADAAGIEVRVVHDAFFVHPNDVKAVKQLSGKVFQDLHANYNIRQKMVEGLSEATGMPIEDILAKIEAKGLTMETKFDIGAEPVERFTNVVRGG